MTASRPQIHFLVQVPEPAHHRIRITLTAGVQGEPLTLALPAWIPGSYMIRDFARNIVKMTARVDGRAVPVERLDKQTWRVAGVSGFLAVDYSIYAHDLSVRGAHVDDSHAYFNGTSVFLRLRGMEAFPHGVRIEQPGSPAAEQWRVATTLPPVAVDARGFGEYRADSYAALIDYPVEIAEGAETRFNVDGVEHRMFFTGRHRADLGRVGADVARICEVHGKLFGMPLPIEQYLFLVTVVGDGYGGLEHCDSTSLICSRGDLPRPGNGEVNDGYRRFLGLCSHEYFHLWNVKRIRPERLASSDLSSEAYSELLWAFEGITSYYDDLALVRAGVITRDAYLEMLGRNVTRLMRGSGRHLQSVAESSFYAWTKFYKQDENAPNAVVSYYVKGGLVALGLDVRLREVSGDQTCLDDLMRALWERYGMTGIDVPEDGIESLAAELAGRDLGDFFGAYVHGTGELPLADWLAALGVGMRLRPARDPGDAGGLGSGGDETPPPRPVLGAAWIADNGAARLTQVSDGGAAQAAGLSPGDIVLAVDGLRAGADSLAERVAACPPHEPVTIHAFRRDELKTFRVLPQPAPPDTCELWLLADDFLYPAARARRDRWLGEGAGAG